VQERGKKRGRPGLRGKGSRLRQILPNRHVGEGEGTHTSESLSAKASLNPQEGNGDDSQERFI